MAQSENEAHGTAEFCALFDDPAHLAEWLKGSLPVVYAFVFARCGADKAIAEDITQETMVEVVRQRRAFDGRAKPLTWVCGIARHKIADYYRSEYREQRRRLRVLETLPQQQRRAGEIDPTRGAVIGVLCELPEAQRVALAFHYLDGLPVREIAERIGRSESAVESLLARGREGFRRAWDQQRGEVT